MKPNEILLNIPENNFKGFSSEEIGDEHLYTGLETPLRADAFDISDTDKKDKIELIKKLNNVLYICQNI